MLILPSTVQIYLHLVALPISRTIRAGGKTVFPIPIDIHNASTFDIHDASDSDIHDASAFDIHAQTFLLYLF